MSNPAEPGNEQRVDGLAAAHHEAEIRPSNAEPAPIEGHRVPRRREVDAERAEIATPQNDAVGSREQQPRECIDADRYGRAAVERGVPRADEHGGGIAHGGADRGTVSRRTEPDERESKHDREDQKHHEQLGQREAHGWRRSVNSAPPPPRRSEAAYHARMLRLPRLRT